MNATELSKFIRWRKQRNKNYASYEQAGEAGDQLELFPDTIDSMTESYAFRLKLQEATDRVDSWPEWKRGILANSFKSKNDAPRKPIT